MTPEEMASIGAQVLKDHQPDDPRFEFWVNIGTMLMVAAVNEDEPVLWTHAQAIAASYRDAQQPQPSDDDPRCRCEWDEGVRVPYPGCPIHKGGTGG